MSRLNPGYFTDLSAFLICSWVKVITSYLTLRSSGGKVRLRCSRGRAFTTLKQCERGERSWGAHAPRVLVMAPRHRDLLPPKSIAARRRNEHARARALPRRYSSGDRSAATTFSL